jgi:hypothetical protein
MVMKHPMERVVKPQPQEMQRQESLVDTPLIPMTMVTEMPRVASLQVLNTGCSLGEVIFYDHRRLKKRAMKSSSSLALALKTTKDSSI